jgi:parvulin-like peptidyl-prolyl isomerase
VKSYLIGINFLKHKVFSFFLIATFTVINFGQINDDETVAKVGNDIISKDEFVERYELTPQLQAGMLGAEESFKKEFLYSLIAEKLWALEAKSMGLDKSELITSTYKAIEKMYVRDALYREEILDKVNISDEYLVEAFQRNSKILNLNYIFSTDPKEIEVIYQQLQGGTNFYSILLSRPEAKLQEKPYAITYGQMDKSVEDKLYSLKLGEFTTPVISPNGWYIFKLLSIQEKTIENSQQASAEEKRIVKIARETIIDSLFREFYSKCFQNVKAETNKELLLQLSDLVIESLRNRSQTDNISASDKIYLTPDDLYDIEANIGSEKLNAVFIKLDDQNETIDDFLQELSIEKFYVDSLDNDHIRGRLNYYARKFIEHELFAREGYKRGLENLPAVRGDLNNWKSYYLCEALRRQIIDSINISDEEADEYFREKKDTLFIVEVKIIELLTNDLDVIKLVLDQLNEGADFRGLAMKYTIREEAKNNNGELGYFNIDEYGEIGRKAATMNIGEMYGPVKVPEGYSLFELVDKKEISDLPSNDYKLERSRIIEEIKNRKYREVVINKTVELANKYKIQINEEILKSVEVLNTTTVIYRTFGFGGKLLAVPMIIPNYDWVKQWENQSNINP